MGQIVFVRHGETLWNKEGRYQGQRDIPLSREGYLQAEQLAKRWKTFPFDCIYSSDLKRSEETARVVRGDYPIPLFLDSRLREVGFGIWEGLTREEVRARYPHLYEKRRRDWEETEVPLAELPFRAQERAMEALYEIFSKHPHETVLLVSHGGLLRLIFGFLLKMPLQECFRLRVENTSVSFGKFVLVDNEVSFVMQSLNDSSHLKRP